MISPDEYFRLALMGLLTSRLDFVKAFDSECWDFSLDDERMARSVALVVVEPDEDLECGPSFGALRKRFPEARIVLISRQGRRDDILDGLRAGAHGCIPKSLSSSDVAQALGLILSGALWIPRFFSEDAVPAAVDHSAPAPQSSDELTDLTPRQREVLRHIVQGKSNKQIAKLLGLREGTVKVHVAGLLRNLGVSNRSRAAALGSRILVHDQSSEANVG